jgi:hypothetical protein
MLEESDYVLRFKGKIDKYYPSDPLRRCTGESLGLRLKEIYSQIRVKVERRRVGQSTLVSGHHLGTVTKLSFILVL